MKSLVIGIIAILLSVCANVSHVVARDVAVSQQQQQQTKDNFVEVNIDKVKIINNQIHLRVAMVDAPEQTNMVILYGVTAWNTPEMHKAIIERLSVPRTFQLRVVSPYVSDKQLAQVTLSTIAQDQTLDMGCYLNFIGVTFTNKSCDSALCQNLMRHQENAVQNHRGQWAKMMQQ